MVHVSILFKKAGSSRFYFPGMAKFALTSVVMAKIVGEVTGEGLIWVRNFINYTSTVHPGQTR